MPTLHATLPILAAFVLLSSACSSDDDSGSHGGTGGSGKGGSGGSTGGTKATGGTGGASGGAAGSSGGTAGAGGSGGLGGTGGSGVFPVAPCDDNSLYVAISGDDNDAGTAAAPFRTIAHGLSVLQGGGTLCIGDGTYDELIVNTIPDGSSAANTVIRAVNANQAILKPTNNPGGNAVIQLSTASYVTIDGLFVDHPGAYWFEGATHHITLQNGTAKGNDTGGCTSSNDEASGIEVGGHDCQILNMDSYDNGCPEGIWSHGIYLAGNNNVVDGNRFHGNKGGYGIHCYHSGGTTATNDNIIRNNVVYDNPKYGVIIASGSGTLFYDNVVYGNGHGVDLTYGASSIQLLNNTIYGNAGSCIDVLEGSGHVTQNNICFQNATDEVAQNGGTSSDDHNLLGDPMFVDASAANFRLKAGSPAIDKGADLSATVKTDITGAPRPIGSAYDIGAYEYTP